MSFWITGLPRSGSAWLANWLTYDGVRCHHEMERRFVSCPSDYLLPDPWAAMVASLGKREGNCSSGLIHCRVPLEGPKIVIERDPARVRDSLFSLGLITQESSFEELLGLYEENVALRWAPALRVPFDELMSEEGLWRIHAHLGLGAPDMDRLAMLREMRVQLVDAGRDLL